MAEHADGYLYQPESVENLLEAFGEARSSGRKVVLRGAGLSYGDAAIGAEAIVVDASRLNRVLGWNAETGVVEVEAGVTIEDLWRKCLPDGWWPPVVSGTMFPTVGGALAMNIHGKNAFRAGPIGEHVLEVAIATPDERRLVLARGEERFQAVVGSAGLLAAIVGAKLQMKRAASGDLRVLALSQRGWDDQFETFERYEGDADYLVSWVDCFSRGESAGRGLIHAAWHIDGPMETLRNEHQDLPSRTLGIPKSAAWRFLRPLTNRAGIRLLNAAKHLSARAIGNGKEHRQSLVAFNFLLDYVPNWRKAYLPGGFIQYQAFVPKAAAREVFAKVVMWQQEARLEAYLGVLKRHRPDDFLLSHGVDGYSLALDFKVQEHSRESLWALCHRMNDLVLDAGGRFYFAKDSTMRPEDARRYLGESALARLKELKREFDSEGLLTSALAERLRLFG